MKNKRNLFLAITIVIYAALFSYLALAIGLYKTIDEQVMFYIMPVHMIMCVVSMYLVVVIIIYMLQDTIMSNVEKWVWAFLLAGTFLVAFISFWFIRVSKSETVTPSMIKKVSEARLKNRR